MSDKSCCCHKKYRSDEEKKKLIHRLNRIEGQIRGLRGMLEDDAYCMDILVQSSAASAALTAFNRELLSTHIESCVVDGIRQGDDEKVEELLSILQKMIKKISGNYSAQGMRAMSLTCKHDDSLPSYLDFQRTSPLY